MVFPTVALRATHAVCLARRLLAAGMFAAGCLVLAAADKAQPLNFNIEAGDATDTLRQFAEQSGQQVIYPTELLKGARARAVTGRFSPREALDRMLAGTTLAVWQDAQTGSLAIRRGPHAVAPVATPVRPPDASPALPPGQFDFDIAAGEADPALKQLARQSGLRVIYPPELVQGVMTRATKGRFAPKDALDRMLAGTSLTALQDRQTGALAIGLVPSAPPERTVALPPYVVEEEAVAVPWRYAQAPDAEILSRCSDLVTEQLIAQHHSLHALLDLILPRELQFRSDLPTAYLFFKDGGKATVPKELLASLRQREEAIVAAQSVRDQQTPDEVEISALPNYRFWDEDALAIFYLWDEAGGDQTRLRLAPGFVRFLLERRTPALPHWFVDGLLELYRRTTMRTPLMWGTGSALGTPYESYSLWIHQAVWMSRDVTQDLLKRPKARIEMLPLAELFSDRPSLNRRRLPEAGDPGGEDRTPNDIVRLPAYIVGEPALRDAEYYERLRRAEAELFIRWMLHSPDRERHRALWRFVERASVQPVTEAMFRDCLGVGYREVEDELQGYVRPACQDSIVLHPATIPELGPVPLRDATAAEISRIKGKFNRLEIPYVRQTYPALAEKYAEQARRTLRKSYDAGDRDPRLMAELGLCECDAGRNDTARPLLEAAVRGRVVRPRAYYELARIQFAAVQPADPDEKLTAAQLASVLRPLYLMRGQAPALGKAYDLMAEAWLRSAASPTPEQLKILRDGVALFPGRTRLILAAALVHAAHGHLREAQTLIDQGLRAAADELERTQFLKLQAIILANRGENK